MTDVDIHEGEQGPVTINDLVDELVVGLMNTRIYWNEHPRVSATVAELTRLLPELGRQHGRSVIELSVVEDQLVFDQRPLIGATLSAPRLIKALHERHAGGIVFECSTTDAEIRELLKLMVEKPPEDSTLGSISLQLEEFGCHSIRLLPPREAKENSDLAKANRLPQKLYQSLVETLQDTTISLCHGGMIDFAKSQTSIEVVLRSLDDGNTATLMNSVRYERYDAYTFGHSVRVAVLAMHFGRTLTDDPGLLNRIGVAALLHDVGKVRVPFEVLHCRTRLDDEQRAEMEKHPVYGAEILMDHDNCDPMALGAAFGHHLDPTGRGYPRVLHDPEVSLVTRIVKLCDVYEALTAVRPYKPAMSPARAFRIMIGMGQAFDQVLLKKFIKSLGVYPDGSRVRLDSGEEAVVVGQTDELSRPIVAIETAADGTLIDPEDRLEKDLSVALSSGSGCAGCVIERMLAPASIEVPTLA